MYKYVISWGLYVMGANGYQNVKNDTLVLYNSDTAAAFMEEAKRSIRPIWPKGQNFGHAFFYKCDTLVNNKYYLKEIN